MLPLTLQTFYPLLIGGVIFLVLLSISLGTTWKWKRVKNLPQVTVVVCARDEEETIFDCMMSLATQDYPVDLYRVLLVDHLSKDRTGELMDKFIESAPINAEVNHITKPDSLYVGKIQGLMAALDQVKSEIVLLTDADCIVPESWIRTIVSYFSNDVVAVGGLVATGEDGIEPTRVTRLQNVDHRYYLGIQAGLAGIAGWLYNLKPFRGSKRPIYRPAFCSGNNLAFRLAAYKEVGGFRAVGPSLVEDHALIKKMLRATGKRIVITLDPEARVQTIPQTSYRGLWHQKRRWGEAMRKVSLLDYTMYLFVFSSKILLPWLLLFHPMASFSALVLVAIGSFMVIQTVSSKTSDHIQWRDILFHEIYQVLLNHSLLIAVLIGSPVFWKGQRYGRGSSPTGRERNKPSACS